MAEHPRTEITIDLDPDAPNYPVRTLTLGQALAAAVRMLNCATRDPDGLQTGPAADRLLSDWAQAVEGMPPLARQTAGRLSAMLSSGTMTSADDRSPDDHVSRAQAALADAGTLPAQLATALSRAQAETAALGWEPAGPRAVLDSPGLRQPGADADQAEREAGQ